MTSSGTYAYNPTMVDIVLDAWDRCGVRPSALTPDHMFSARRSINQVLVRWANRAVNLWLVDEITVPIVSGQQSYDLETGTVCLLDVFTRNYQLGDTTDLTVALATTISTSIVSITWASNGLVADQWISIPIPIAIGGLIIQGFYQVYDIVGLNTINIDVGTNATSSATGGALPVYGTVANDGTVTVTLANHGFLAGQPWTVHVTTNVGGLSLLGEYTITSTPTANTLTFEAGANAGTTDTATENFGLMQIAAANSGALPQDRIMMPLGREEWASIPAKTQTAQVPTSYWFDRLIAPKIYIWPLPDINAPLELHYFRMRQIQDGDPQNTQTPDIPYRAEEAFCAELAAHLAIKWAVDKVPMLKVEAQETWAEFAHEDRERVNLKFQPDLSGYYT